MLLKENEISSYKLAKAIGVSQSTIANYLNGKVKPSSIILKQIAFFFNVDFDWLLNDDKDSLELNRNTQSGNNNVNFSIISKKTKLRDQNINSNSSNDILLEKISELEKKLIEKDKLLEECRKDKETYRKLLNK